MSRVRLALSIRPDVDEILERLSVCLSKPKSRIIAELLIEVAPALDQTVKALEKVKRDEANALTIARDYANDALLTGNKSLGQLALEIEKMKW